MLFPLPSENPVAVPEVSAAVQVKAAPAAVLDSEIAADPPEQMAWETGTAVISGRGFTVTTTVIAVP